MKRRNVLKTMVAGALPLAALERVANARPLQYPDVHAETHHAPGLGDEKPPIELAGCNHRVNGSGTVGGLRLVRAAMRH